MAVPSVSTGTGSRRARARTGPPSSRILRAPSCTRSTSTISADRRRPGDGAWSLSYTSTHKTHKKKKKKNRRKARKNQATNELAKVTKKHRKLRLQKGETPKRIQPYGSLRFEFASFCVRVFKSFEEPQKSKKRIPNTRRCTYIHICLVILPLCLFRPCDFV